MATPLATALKSTPPGSHYAFSNPDAVMVTVPNPTPLTEALNNEVVDPPPNIDVHAMIKILEPIAESLNEAAEEAMYPTPPINTPAITSPASSAIYRYPCSRSHGMSTIGDRLARAKIDSHRYTQRDSDIFSNSGHSMLSSTAEDESDSISDLLSDGERDRHEIHIALGSPRINAMGLISFTSNDLADRPPVPFESTAVIPSASATIDTDVGSGSLHSDSVKSGATGVTEMSTWKEEVESEFERALQRLENLANDEHKLDPSKPTEHYYQAHLRRLLAAPNRKLPVSIALMAKTQ